MIYNYEPRGVCAYDISFELEDGRVRNVSVLGGCDGNLKAIAKLVEGMDARRAIDCLRGIDCDGKGTSCPDQLSIALEMALEGKLK